MTKSNGIKSLKQAAKLLNRHAPAGESLAYINPEEGRILKSHGASGIMTVAGIPSYAWYDFLKPVGEAITKYAPKVLDYGQKALDLFSIGSSAAADTPDKRSTGTEYSDPYWQTPGINSVGYPNIHEGENIYNKENNPFWQDVGGSILQSGKEFLKGRYGGADAIKNISKDALSVWTALKTKKDQEGLNNAEMEQFNKLNQQLMLAQAEFTSNIEGGGVTNMPTDITDVASYTDVTLPAMKTTAVAEGGRIGYNQGSGKTYDDWLNYRIKEIAAQRIPVPFELWKKGEIEMAQGGRIGYSSGTEDGALKKTYNKVIQRKIKMLQGMKDSGIEISAEDDKWLQEHTGQAQGGRIGYDEGIMAAAYGGRIGAQKGGIMPLLDMGGIEKDYRQDGGFVPIGRREKADDVPARLSKNEFVFTADAVRAAGGGDIDQGAQRMYNVMKNLEAGGEISEQSQGQG